MTGRVTSLVLSFAVGAAARHAPQPLRESIDVQLRPSSRSRRVQ